MFFKVGKKSADIAIFYFQTAGSVPFRLKLYAARVPCSWMDTVILNYIAGRTFLKTLVEAFHAARWKTGTTRVRQRRVRQRRDSANCFVSSVSLHFTFSVSHLIEMNLLTLLKRSSLTGLTKFS
jgi:hypothetical protein